MTTTTPLTPALAPLLWMRHCSAGTPQRWQTPKHCKKSEQQYRLATAGFLFIHRFNYTNYTRIHMANKMQHVPAQPYRDDATRIIGTKVTPEMHRQVRELAVTLDTNVSAVVRQAITEYVQKHY
ncbi:hypothetical protein [Cupriavidus necator]